MRDIGSNNLAQVNSDYLEPITLVKIEFTAATVRVHSGYGLLTAFSETYIGAGNLGSVSAIREERSLKPAPVTMTLSGINPIFLEEALDSSEFEAAVTIYEGYRQDDGTLVADPWVKWSGWWESASVAVTDQMIITATAQHDLAILDEIDGRRFTDEDQQQLYSGDTGFRYVPFMADLTLAWAGGRVGSITGGGIPGDFGGEATELPFEQK